MNKKSQRFVFMAVMAALLIAVGCDNGTTTTDTVYQDRNIGYAADLAGLQVLLEEPGINPVNYYGDLAVGSNNLVVPAGKTLNVVEGGVTVGVSGLFAVGGTLTLGDGYEIDNSGTVAGNAAVLDKISGDSSGKAGSLVSGAAGLAGAFDDADVALLLTASAADFTSANIPSGKTLYVSNLTLTEVPTPSGAGSLIVLEKVTVSGTLNLGSIVAPAANEKLTIASGATLANTAVAAVTLPAGTLTLKAIEAGIGAANLTIAGATGLEAERLTGDVTLSDATSLTITGQLTGDVDLPGAVTAVTIAGGAGTVELKKAEALTLATAVFGNTGGVSFTGAGGVTFNGAAAVAGSLSVTGPTTIAGTLTVGGVATIATLTDSKDDTNTVTFNGASATIASYAAKATDKATTFAGSANLIITELTDNVSETSKVIFNGTKTTQITAYTAKVTANATTFEGTANLTIATLTDIDSGESTVTFDGTGLTTITNAVTPLHNDGLIIAGSGLVVLEAAPVLTNPLSIANTDTGSVYFTSLVVNTTDTVTLTNAALAAGDEGSPISLASNADLTLGEDDVLALASGGTIVVAGDGEIAIGEYATISGIGTWTATTGDGEYLVIVAGSSNASIAAFTNDQTPATSQATLTASITGSGAPAITVAAEKELVIGPKITIDLGNTVGAKLGEIVLTNGSTPAKLSFAGEGAQIITGKTGGSALAAAGGVFAASGSTEQDVIPVSAFVTENHVVITGGENSLVSIVFGDGDAYITGPASASGSPAGISAATDCVTE
jgi:hypothetical protein